MKYYLYLDEMLANLTTSVYYFSFAGFVVSEIERDILDAKFNKLKNKHSMKVLFIGQNFVDLKNYGQKRVKKR